MYQNCCKKCGSVELFTESKGTNVGLYCSDCGAWVKWMGKDELNAFNHSQLEKLQADSNNSLDTIKNKATKLWHELQESEMTISNYKQAKSFILDLFSEDE